MQCGTRMCAVAKARRSCIKSGRNEAKSDVNQVIIASIMAIEASPARSLRHYGRIPRAPDQFQSIRFCSNQPERAVPWKNAGKTDKISRIMSCDRLSDEIPRRCT